MQQVWARMAELAGVGLAHNAVTDGQVLVLGGGGGLRQAIEPMPARLPLASPGERPSRGGKFGITKNFLLTRQNWSVLYVFNPCMCALLKQELPDLKGNRARVELQAKSLNRYRGMETCGR